MVDIKVICDNGERAIKAKKGANLLRTLAEHNINIPASCGGKGKCGKCKVQLIYGKVNCATDEKGFFNSCECFVDSDISIKVKSVAGEGIVKTADIAFDIKVQQGYGIAIDIGTTTIAYYLVNLKKAVNIDTKSDLNKQAMYGGDVISRIDASKNGQLQNLQKTIVSQINEAIDYFCKKHSTNEISKMVISGNTTMLHLVLGVDPSSMGVYPFEPTFVDTVYTNKPKSGINCDDIILLPSVSAYIGSDIVSGALSGGLAERPGVSLLVDIGTNGEMILNNNGKMVACATAAGPAFEGANIEMGMAGVKHAIDHFRYQNKKLTYTTLGGEALGICGSGLVDIIATLVESKNIDETGLLTYSDEVELNNKISENKFYITDKVYLTQKDIREFQLAKSAIKSGILTLLDSENISPNDIDVVLLAGGFGNYLDKSNAIITGLLPKEFENTVESVGNASGLGAKMCLLNSDYILRCQAIAKDIEVIELANSSVFMDNFIENMSFDAEMI